MITCPHFITDNVIEQEEHFEGTGHIGDKVIEERLKTLVNLEKGEQEYFVLFREMNLKKHLDKSNSSKAILLPAMAIRDNPIYPGTYRRVDDLSRIKVPIIPFGAQYNNIPEIERQERL